MFKRLAKALIRLRVCTGWSEPLLVAHTTLLEISCRGSFIITTATQLRILLSIIDEHSYDDNFNIIVFTFGSMDIARLYTAQLLGQTISLLYKKRHGIILRRDLFILSLSLSLSLYIYIYIYISQPTLKIVVWLVDHISMTRRLTHRQNA